MPRKPTLSEEFRAGVRLAFRELVPPLHDREPATWGTVHRAFAYLLPFFFMAYLVRRANTHAIRILLLPTVITSTIYCTYHYRVKDPRYFAFEWIRCMMCYYIIPRSLNFAFTKNGRFKVGEKRLPEINEPVPYPMNTTGDSKSHTKAGRETCSILPMWFRDALEVSLSLRGIGWDFGRGVYVPPDSRPTQRSSFIGVTLLSLLKNLLIVDFCDSFLKLVPGVGSVGGGSMFIPGLPSYARYTLSTTVQILGGTLVICGLEAGNEFAAIISVGLLGQSPTEWPPLYDNPWRACSLTDFWGKCWHQVLRQTFLTVGGYPGYWIAGKAGMVLGSFLASGLYHEIGLHMSDHRVTLFFLLQGVGILLESLWTRITGKKVSGVVGWVWTAFGVLVLGQMCMDAWAIGGLAGVTLVPKRLSFTRRVLFPALRSLVEPSSQ